MFPPSLRSLVTKDARSVRIIDRTETEHLAQQRLSSLRQSLTSRPIAISPLWFYDEEGSLLFDQITRLDEYYPTRTERAILEREAVSIVELAQPRALVELGSGTCEKTRVILDAMEAAGLLDCIVPLDISAEMLERSVHELAGDYPRSSVVGVAADFTDGLAHLEPMPSKMVTFLGSTIGNLLPDERANFLSEIERSLAPGDWFLLGCDLIKDTHRLLAAYDDALGLTGTFNRNMLVSLNHAVGASFDPERFDHVVTWNPTTTTIEMRLRAQSAMTVDIEALEISIDFHEGEEILTETCSKFTVVQMRDELSAAGLVTEAVYLDDDEDFALLLARPFELGSTR